MGIGAKDHVEMGADGNKLWDTVGMRFNHAGMGGNEIFTGWAVGVNHVGMRW